MALYEHRCNACGKKRAFPTRFDATRSGWGLAEVWFGEGGGVKYFVFCETCVPAWLAGAVADGEKRKSDRGK